MSPQVRDVQVQVTPLLVQGDTVVCEIDGNPPHVKGGLIKLRRGGPNYRIIFELPEDSALQFESAGADAFWCDTSSCPRTATHNSSSQLGNPQVTNGGRTLTVDATPQGPKNAVHYSLNFNNGGRYDPIIINE